MDKTEFETHGDIIMCFKISYHFKGRAPLGLQPKPLLNPPSPLSHVQCGSTDICSIEMFQIRVEGQMTRILDL